MPSDRRFRSARIAATSLAIAALAAPAAGARPAIDPPGAQPASAAAAQKHTPVVMASTADRGFDWGSAEIGAAAGAGLVLVGAGSVALSYRGRVRVAR